jgi:hypothetical protein
MPNIVINGWDFHNAPKNGGTTVRMWLKFYEGNFPSDISLHGYYNLATIGIPRQWTDNSLCEPQFFFAGASENQRWCIVRDPVDRFISAYSDKILRERLAPWSLGTCLSLMESGEMELIARSPGQTKLKQAACHMLGQCFWFGQNKKYYHRVFNIGEMNRVRDFCESVFFKISLPDFHARNQLNSDIKKIKLSRREVCRIEKIYEADYMAGWC